MAENLPPKANFVPNNAPKPNGAPMAQPAQAAQPAGDAPLIFPPEETIWKKYSPHYEFPLSVVASCVTHMFVFMVVTLFGAILFSLGSAEPPDLDTVEFAGGGGSGENGTTPPEQADSAMPDPDLSFKLDDVAIDDSAKKELTADLSQDKQNVDNKFDDPSKKVGDQGKGGSGSGGGFGDGFGTGEGSGAGPGKQNRRAKRTDRWAIEMSYSNGEELYQEWAKLKAVILIPDGPPVNGNYNKFRVYRDLSTKSPQGKVESREAISTLNRVWFMDKTPDSVGKLAGYLNLPARPRFMAFFIPRELEDELLRKELSYKGKKEDQLEGWLTTFRVSRVGDNKFNATVVSQVKEKK